MKKSIATLVLTVLTAGSMFAQLRPAGQDGLNVFESQKKETYSSDFKLEIGGGFTQSYQTLKNDLSAGADAAYFKEIYPGLNLAAANLDIKAYLAEGVTLNMELYLASRHHNETWVKGGFLQFDRLPFLQSELVDNIMQYVTIKAGHMEINYGDAHFRRSDGGNTMYNAFIENNIMDAFDTEIGGEILGQYNGFLGMVGMSNGAIKGNITTKDAGVSIYGKIGYDKQINDDFRVRATGSIYKAGEGLGSNLFGGDRTGSNYFYTLYSAAQYTADSKGAHTSGRYNPGFKAATAMSGNLLLKYKGLESFTTVETVGLDSANAVNQFATELVYRFGSSNQFWAGAKYNTVMGLKTNKDVNINRLAISGGWFITKNVSMKAEYVKQVYELAPAGKTTAFAKEAGNGFSGFSLQAAIGF